MGSGPIFNVARGAISFNAIGATPILKIHPAIGVARVGDAPSAFYIGPERPLAGSTGKDGGAGSSVPSFRDGGKIKRQAARFRIFNYGGSDPEELTLDHPEVKEIEWTVHLANRKAAFFEFQGQLGAAGPFSGAKPNLRNSTIPAADRDKKLVIDPGPRSIKGASKGPVKFDSGTGNFPKNSAGAPVIDFLGELRTDDKGRLLVLGGHGKSASSDSLPPSTGQMTELAVRGGGTAPPLTGAGRPAAPILTYANNDTWFDDVSDGPVTAKVKLKNGKTLNVDFPGWVLVGPPDFAPEIRNVISLYDTALDVAVRKLPAPSLFSQQTPERQELIRLKADVAGVSPPTPLRPYQPEFFFDVEPTIHAGFEARFVHEPVHVSHGTLDQADLKNPAPAAKGSRDLVFNFLRPPAGNKIYAGFGSMPKLFGDKYDVGGDPKQVAAVTETQHHILALWKDGNFTVGSPGPRPGITPGGLDRAALEGCVGGAFFPGIECSWLIREGGVYQEPFRIKHGATVGPLTVGPGFFSQQMALPWQADFLDCAKDDGTVGTFFGWWPAQRPDDVYTSEGDAATQSGMVPWARGIVSVIGRRGSAHENMVANWNKLGFALGAVVAGKKVFSEKDRTLP